MTKEPFALSLRLQIEDESGKQQEASVLFENGRAGLSFRTAGKVRQVILDPQSSQLFGWKLGARLCLCLDA